MTNRPRHLRPSLLCRTALGTALFAAAAVPAFPAFAQVSPGSGSLGGGTVLTAGQVNSIATNGSGGTTYDNTVANTSTVTLGNSRTIVGWNGFNLSAGQTLNFVFGGRGDIVLNRIDGGAATINGGLRAAVGAVSGAVGGNVWFVAPGGVTFGSNAVVNVGGLLATTAQISSSDFLDGDASYTFTAPGVSAVSVNSGAQLRVHGGTLALIAPNVTTAAGSAITDQSAGAHSDVLFGAADEYTITFAPDTAGDLDFVSWTVPSAAVGTNSSSPLNIAGTTTAGNVYLAAVSRSAVTSVVSASGAIVANGAVASGDGRIILTGGGGITSTGLGTDLGNRLNVTTNNLTASNSVIVHAAGTGTVQTGNLASSGSVTVDGASLILTGVNGGGNVSLSANGGNVNVSSLAVGGNYSVTGQDFLNAALSPTFTGSGNAFTITDTLGGFSTGSRTAPGLLTINTTNGGGLTVSGALSGANVALNSTGGINQTGGGSITTAGTLTAQATGGAVDLNDTSHNVTTLGPSSGAAGFAYADANGLVVNNTVSGGTGDVSIASGVGGLLNLSGAQITTSGGGNIALTGGGGISIGSTSIDSNVGSAIPSSADGDVTLTGAVSASGSNFIVGDNIGFTGTIGGAGALDIRSASGTTFNGSVALQSLSVTGPTRLNTGSVSTSGSLTLGDVVVAAATPVTMQATGAGSLLTVGKITDADTTANVLVLSANGAGGRIRSSGVGTSGAPFGNVTFTSPTTELGGDVFSSGAVSFSGGLALGAGTNIITGTDVTFNGAVDALLASNVTNLTVTANGAGASDNVTFGSTVGATAALDSLAVNGVTVLAGASFNTDVAQSWNGAVTLSGGGTKAFNGGAGSVSFNSTLDGGSTANVNAGGGITFGGNVGLFTRLTALNTSGGGVTNLNGGEIRTTGGQSYSGSVVLGANTTLDALSGGLIFNAGITGNFALQLRTTADSFLNGAVNIGSLTTDAGGNTRINNTAGVTTTGNQTYGDVILLGTGVALTGVNGSFTSISGDSANRDLTLNFSGSSSALTTGTLSSIRNLSVGGGGTTSVGGVISTAGTQTYTDALNLSGNTVLTSIGSGANGNISIGAVTGNGNDLTLTSTLNSSLANPTTVTFGGVVSGINVLDVDAGSVAVNGALAASTVTLTALHGGITVGADLTGTSAATLDASGAIVGTGRVSGSAVALIGASGIGTSSIPLNTAATTLSARSSGGSVWISEQNGVTLQDNGALTNGAAATYSLTAAGSIAVNGSITAPLGVTLTTTSGNIAFGAAGQMTASSGGISLTAADIISGGGGALVAQNIALTADDFASGILGAATLQETNNLSITDTLGGLTISTATGMSAANGLTITTTNGGGLSVGGVAAPGFITLNSSGALTLTDTINAGSGLVTLISAGGITQSSGSITAGLLGGSSVGSTVLTSASNAITALGNFTANGFSLAKVGALDVIGAVDGGAGGVSLTTTDDLRVGSSSTISATGGTIALTASGFASDIVVQNAAGIGSGAADLSVVAGGVLQIAGPAKGRDVALRAGGALTAGAISARDDVALNAAGVVTAGAISSGVAVDSLAATDVAGAADSLTGTTLTGNDIDIRSAGLQAGALRAIGTGSDIRVQWNGGTIGHGGQDLDWAAGGDITTNGALQGRDIALSAGGAVTIATGYARDDIAIRAGGALTTSTLYGAQTVDSLAATDVAGAADTLAGTALAGADLTLSGASANVGFLGTLGAGNSVSVAASGGSLITNGINATTVGLSATGGDISLLGGLTVTGVATLTATGNITQGSTLISAGVLTGSSGGTTTLTNTANSVAQIGAFSANGFAFTDARSLTLVGALGGGAGGVTVQTTGGNLTIASSGSVSGAQVVLSTNQNFINQSGADAVVASGKWTIYSASPTTSVFDSLNSGNTAIWNGTLATKPAATLAGNRYVFAFQPTVTVSSTDVAKVYGTDLTASLNSAYTVSGLHTGVANAFQADTAAGILSGTPSITSAGSAANADVSGSPYATSISQGTLGVANGYSLVLSNPGTISITPLGITAGVAANDKTYDGTTAATGSVTLSGVVAGDSVGTTSGSFAFADKNAGLDKTVTVSGVSLTGADAGNYTLTVPASTLADILQKAITAGVVANDKTYDGTTAATGSVTLSGVVAGDSVGTTSGSFAFADKNAGLDKTVTVSGVSLTGADAGNYTLTVPASTLADILQKAITAGVVANDKTYDGTTAATGSVTLSGVVAGDSVGTTSGSFAFADKNAGLDKTVTVSRVSLTGADAGNYTLTVPASTLADILQKAITAGVVANDKTYDGTTAATGSVTLSGVVAGDSVGTTSGSFAFADKNAGLDKTVTVSGVSLTGADAGNYTLTVPASTLADILQKAITAGVVANDKTYDGTTAATGSVTLSGVVAGDSVGTTSGSFAFADKNAGLDKTVTVSGVSLTGADAGNYTLTVPASTLADILQKAITAGVVANDKTYDGTTAATGSVTLSGVVAGDSVGTTSGSFAFADKNAGLDKTVTVSGVSLTGADAGNYTLTVPASTLADILQRAITVTANPQSRAEGQADPTLTFTVTSGSLVAGENLQGNLSRASGEAPGAYAIVQGSLGASANYKLTFVGSTLIITPVVVETPPAPKPIEGLGEFLEMILNESRQRIEAPLLVIGEDEQCEPKGDRECRAKDR